jgi:hypothetical protein
MGEAELSLFNPFRAIDLCNLAIKNYCKLLSSVTLDQVRKQTTFNSPILKLLTLSESQHFLNDSSGLPSSIIAVSLFDRVT